MNDAVVLSISESSQAGEARRLALTLATKLGFNDTERGKVGIVVTEVANNLVRHAKEGSIVLQTIENQEHWGIEILSLDKGPGMANITECLQDGFSSTGTPGNGLGAIRRLSTRFEIHSALGIGTAILAQLWAEAELSQPTSKLQFGAVCLPKPGQSVSGDHWASIESSDRSLLLVVDGLGHGGLAAEAASAAVRVFRENGQKSPKALIETMHQSLRRTRGAALAIAEINFDQQTVQYAGVGNIAGTILSIAGTSRMVSHNGTVGHEIRKIQEFSYPWTSESTLIMHSDGLSNHWQVNRYLGLIAKHPSLIAGILYRDFSRDRDDVAVVVARESN